VLFRSVLTSLRTAVDATWMAMLLGILVARAARTNRVLDGLFMLPLGVSAVTLGFGFLLAFGAWRDHPLLVPLAQALVALPLVVRTLTPVWAGIDDHLRDAAATLGATPWQTLRKVDLPLLRPALLSAAGTAAAVSLGEFGATTFLARDSTPTLPVLIYRLIGRPGADNHGAALAASVALAVLIAAVLLLAEAGKGRVGSRLK
jgi:thiamine transport system permease protein